MTDVVISSMRYRGIEKMTQSQLEHMDHLVSGAISNYAELVAHYNVAPILYDGKTYLQQLQDASVAIKGALNRRAIK